MKRLLIIVIISAVLFVSCAPNATKAVALYNTNEGSLYKVDYRSLPGGEAASKTWIMEQFHNIVYLGKFGNEWIIYCEDGK